MILKGNVVNISHHTESDRLNVTIHIQGYFGKHMQPYVPLVSWKELSDMAQGRFSITSEAHV